jgi:hypothetical protein
LNSAKSHHLPIASRGRCHGEPYTTKVLVPEAFEEHRVPIYADTLRDRLPATLIVADEREREIYGVMDEAEINRILKSYSDFVELCARARKLRQANPASL